MNNKFSVKGFAITIVLFAVSVNANAQWVMGGEVGLNVRNENANDLINDRNYTFTSIGFKVAPNGGYYFNEKFALGLSFSVGGTFDFGINGCGD
jgi:hypothetical protein